MTPASATEHHRNDRYRGRPERAKYSDESEVVRPTFPLLIRALITHPFFSQNRTARQDRCPAHPRSVHIPPPSTAPSQSTTASHSTRLPFTTPSHYRIGPPGRWSPSALDLTTPPDSEPRVGMQTVRAMPNAGWPTLLAALFFLLITNVSDPYLEMSSACCRRSSE